VFAQFLALLLSGAGHGWTTPFFVTLSLWVLFPATFVVATTDGPQTLRAMIVLAVIALGADALLINGTLAEREILPLYVQVNGAVGLSIIGLWLAIWLFWQGVLVKAMLKATARSAAE
jgi:hypothetical protein